MNNISLALAVYNEEKKLPNLLKSVYQWVDEIVIVDGGSTDQTREIAQKYKARIISSDNPINFHINKQKAIEACTKKWILQLDADEVVPENLKKEILLLKEEKEIHGYWIPRKNYFLGTFLTKGGQYPDWTLRLYRRGKGTLPAKSVHEQAVVIGKTVYLTNPLLHFSYTHFSEYLEHFNRYTSIFAKEFEEQKIVLGWYSSFVFLVIKPCYWFLFAYIRHKGFLDGFPGFVFSFFSSLRFPVAYIKYWEKVRNSQT